DALAPADSLRFRQRCPNVPLPPALGRRALALLALPQSKASRRAAVACPPSGWRPHALRYQGEAQQRCLATQRTLLLLPQLLLVFLQRLLNVFSTVLQHAVHQTGQLVRRCRDRPLAAEAALDPPVEQG